MATTKTISTLLAVIFVFSLLSLSIPGEAKAQQGDYVSGCCQFFVDDAPGCMYPSSPDSCSGENRTFVEGGNCEIDTGYCTGYKKNERSSSKEAK